MKGKLLLASATVATMGLISFKSVEISGFTNYKKHAIQSGGGQSGLTGAPGEANCTQCHRTGNDFSLQDGNGINSLTVASGITQISGYEPGETYNVSLQTSGNSNKKGFSAVALDANNNNAGSFSASGSTQNFSAPTGDRQYVSHTSTGTSAIVWVWQWTAPATDVGDVTFYVACNQSNANNTNDSGDQIYLSQHVIGSSASINENEQFNSNFAAGFNNETNQLNVTFSSLVSNTMFLNLVDMSGKSVFTYSMEESNIGENNETIMLPNNLKSGIYVVHFFVGNNAMSSKIVVQ